MGDGATLFPLGKQHIHWDAMKGNLGFMLGRRLALTAMLFAVVFTPVVHVGMHRAEASERGSASAASAGLPKAGGVLSTWCHTHEDDCPICGFLAFFHAPFAASAPALPVFTLLFGRPAVNIVRVVRRFLGIPLGLRAPPASPLQS
jgi:hypothetical protein